MRPSWYHNMSSVLQAGPCVRTNQLDFDDEVVFRARQYLYDHVRTGDGPAVLPDGVDDASARPYTIPAEWYDRYRDDEIPMPRVEIAREAQDPIRSAC